MSLRIVVIIFLIGGIVGCAGSNSCCHSRLHDSIIKGRSYDAAERAWGTGWSGVLGQQIGKKLMERRKSNNTNPCIDNKKEYNTAG